MMKNRMLMTKITKYYNYLERPNIWYKELVTTLPNMTLRSLFIRRYENSGNFMYKINKYE